MEFTVTLREDDLYRAMRLATANRRARPLLLAALLCALLIALLLMLSPGSVCVLLRSPLSMMLIGAVVLAAFLVTLALAARGPLWRSMARRTLAQRRELATPIEWAFDDNGLRVATRFTRSDFPWDALAGWREDRDVLLVYLSDQLFHTVPKDQIDEAQVSALRTALESHGVPRR
jgi:hypothetical protein